MSSTFSTLSKRTYHMSLRPFDVSYIASRVPNCKQLKLLTIGYPIGSRICTTNARRQVLVELMEPHYVLNYKYYRYLDHGSNIGTFGTHEYNKLNLCVNMCNYSTF